MVWLNICVFYLKCFHKVFTCSFLRRTLIDSNYFVDFIYKNFTGGPNGGKHVTDITNASRTMLLNITKQKWDDELLKFFGIPKSCLPEIRSNAEHYGDMVSVLPWVESKITSKYGECFFKVTVFDKFFSAIFGKSC